MKNSNNKPLVTILVIIVSVVTLLLFSILGIILIGGFFSFTSSDSERVTNSPSSEDSKDIYSPESITEYFYDDTTEYTESTTRKNETTTVPEVTQPRPSTNTVLISEGLYIISNTPNGSGTQMKKYPTSTSASKGTIREGTLVRVLSDDASNQTGYVQVLAYTDPMDTHCFIRKDHLTFKGYPNYYTAPTSNSRHISYNTPGHAGVNMRTAPSSTAGNLGILEEGTPVFIAEPYSSANNGYIKVGCDETAAGETIYGWVLYNYLAS